MKTIFLSLSVFFIVACYGQSNSTSTPTNLSECLDVLMRELSAEYKDSIKKSDELNFVASAHMSLGFKIRGYWGLNSGESELSKFFQNLGIRRSDDMSGIILTSFHRFINNKPIELNVQVENYKKSYRAQERPLKAQYPKGAENLEIINEYDYPKTDYEAKAFIGKIPNSNIYWFYDSELGWKQLTEENLNKFYEAYDDEKEKIVIDFYKKNK